MIWIEEKVGTHLLFEIGTAMKWYSAALVHSYSSTIFFSVSNQHSMGGGKIFLGGLKDTPAYLYSNNLSWSILPRLEQGFNIYNWRRFINSPALNLPGISSLPLKTILRKNSNLPPAWNKQGVDSFTISTINFSIHGSSEKRFFDKLYEGARAESSIYNVKNYVTIIKVLICSFGPITGNILHV